MAVKSSICRQSRQARAGVQTGASVFDHRSVGRTQLQNKIVIIMAPMVKLICMDMWKDIIHVIFKGFDDWIDGECCL